MAYIHSCESCSQDDVSVARKTDKTTVGKALASAEKLTQGNGGSLSEITENPAIESVKGDLISNHRFDRKTKNPVFLFRISAQQPALFVHLLVDCR